MVTYGPILTIYTNYIIPNLGEYILKCYQNRLIIVKIHRARSISQNKRENIFYSKDVKISEN